LTEAGLKALNLLLAYEQHLQHTKYDVLNFQSESMMKVRKLAHLEGELAGIQAAIEMVEAVSSGASVSSLDNRIAGSKK
jgi:capsule polysaccharide export protein KpsE/RkpR